MGKILFCNAQIVTMDEKNKNAEAVLVENGKIKKVGTNEEVLSYADDETEIKNLYGKTLMPGFIDPHSHLTAVAYNLLMVNANPSPTGNCNTKEELLAEFQKAFEEGDFSDGRWLMGMGYDNSVFPDGKHITRLDLDAISTEIPISCIHASGHCGVVNTKALQILGYWGDFEVPQGGTVERFENGEPNGLITENAFIDPNVQKKMKTPAFEDVIDSIKNACDMYASFGITSCQDSRVTMNEYQLLTEAGKRGRINIDVLGMAAPQAAEKILVKGQTTGTYENHVRIGGYKIFLDGSPQAKTAWLSEPYFVAPEGKSADYCGFGVMKDEDVIAAAKLCLNNAWQLNVHCNGDEACEQFIRCYTTAIKETGVKKDLRPVMVHAQTVREDQLDRMKEIGIIPTYFLDHVYYWGDWHYESVLGPKRAERISPIRSTIHRDMNFTMHQDSPVVNPNALFAVHNAVNRITKNGRLLGADQRITVEEALKGITINGAYQIFEEEIKGSITEGKIADLVILDENPLAVDLDEIKNIKVLETIKEGKSIYKR